MNLFNRYSFFYIFLTIAITHNAHAMDDGRNGLRAIYDVKTPSCPKELIREAREIINAGKPQQEQHENAVQALLNLSAGESRKRKRQPASSPLQPSDIRGKVFLQHINHGQENQKPANIPPISEEEALLRRREAMVCKANAELKIYLESKKQIIPGKNN